MIRLGGRPRGAKGQAGNKVLVSSRSRAVLWPGLPRVVARSPDLDTRSGRGGIGALPDGRAAPVATKRDTSRGGLDPAYRGPQTSCSS